MLHSCSLRSTALAVKGTLTLALLAAAAPARAQADGEWTTVATGRLTLKTRTLPGTTVREVLALGVLQACAADVQTAITTTARYPHFMPNVKTARELRPQDADGGRYVYTRVTLPVVSDRDFVTHDRVRRSLDADGGGAFESSWQTVKGLVPTIDGVVRVTLNTGSWRVVSLPGGRTSQVAYRYVLDAGGSIPVFLGPDGQPGRRSRPVRRPREGSAAPGRRARAALTQLCFTTKHPREGGHRMRIKKNVVFFSVTDFCNARCSYCSFWKTAKAVTPPRPDLETIVSNIRNKLGCGFLQVTGGEPLSYAGTYELIERATRHDMLTLVMTNGSLLNAERIERLDRAGLKMLSISVDHHDGAVFDGVRGLPGLLKKNVENFTHIAASRIVSMAGITVTKHNIDHLEATTAFLLKETPVEKIGFCLPLVGTGSTYALGNPDDDAAELSNEQMLDVVGRLTAVRLRYKGRIANHPAYFDDMKRYYSGQAQAFTCTAGETLFYVDNRLDVFRCMTRPQKLGNLMGEVEVLKNAQCSECPLQCFREGAMYHAGLRSLPLVASAFFDRTYWKRFGRRAPRALPAAAAGVAPERGGPDTPLARLSRRSRPAPSSAGLFDLRPGAPDASSPLLDTGAVVDAGRFTHPRWGIHARCPVVRRVGVRRLSDHAAACPPAPLAPKAVNTSTVKQVVGAAGGTLEHPTGAKLVVPPGALAADVELSITGAEAPGTGQVGAPAVGQAFVLGPEGQQFTAPLSIEVPVDPALVQSLNADVDELRLRLAPQDTLKFVELATTADTARQVLIAQLTHFSVIVPVVSGSAFTFSTSGLPAASVGVPYSGALVVSGGTGPYAFSLAAGSLPPGLDLNAQGIFSGTPSQAGKLRLHRGG